MFMAYTHDFFCSLCFVEGIKQLCLPQASLSLSHSVTCFLWAFSFFVFFAIQKGSLKNASILLNVPYNIFCITTAMCVCRCEWMCPLRDILKNRFMQAMLDLFFYCVILNVHDTQKFTVIFFSLARNPFHFNQMKKYHLTSLQMKSISLIKIFLPLMLCFTVIIHSANFLISFSIETISTITIE